VSPNSIYEYFQYLQNVFFVKTGENYFKWWRKQKVFLFNPWVSQVFNPWKDLWQKFENMVFLELLRKFWNVFYKSNWWEVDFFIPEKDLNIQVCFNLTDDNIERELNSLLKQRWERILVYFQKDIDIPNDFGSVKFMEYFDFYFQMLKF
jgi:predicted AAA+ superfamily ATPase